MHEKAIHIAVMISTLDEEYQSGILSGIRHYCENHGIMAEIFAAFGNTGSDLSHDIGEYNIFSLADLERFDGVILVINTIQDADCMEKLIRRVRESGIPAVCIDKDVAGMDFIGIDNESSMYAMMEHFIVQHGFTKINYVSGPDNNIESAQRLRAYRRALEDHGIAIEEERIFKGHFISKDGMVAAERFLESPLGLPEAIVCANDNMAVAVMNTLIRHDVRVPQDVCVSGFDNTMNAQNYAPALTSVKRPLRRVGMLACEKIMAHLNGKPMDRVTILKTECCFSQSCGCSKAKLMPTDEFKRHNYNVLEYFKSDISLSGRISSALAECDNIDDYVAELRWFVPEFYCDEFYLCLCDNWKEGLLAEDTDDDELPQVLEQERRITEGFGETAIVALAYKDGKFSEVAEYPIGEMLPGLFDEGNVPGCYYFIPLHFRERTMGYIVIKNSAFPYASKLFHNCIMNIANSLESVRKIICLDRVTRKLNDLYTIDNLAKINNRNGFRLNTQHLFQYCIDNRLPAMLMFLDMDGLKSINDNYGHKAGDAAIAAMADVLNKVCVNGEVCCRFGGDEFIIFAADYTEEDAEYLSGQIAELLQEKNESFDYPCRLETSLGYHITVPEPDMNLFQLVTQADNVMYEQKKRKKKSKYLKN
jgi:diguanylate cyclase (GGDEF)-like protein